MENITQYKNELVQAYMMLSESRRQELKDFYSNSTDMAFTSSIFRDAKESAQSVINFADRRGYGYGEVGYNLNENVAEFAEDVPELEKQYKRLQRAYFEFLTEAKEI